MSDYAHAHLHLASIGDDAACRSFIDRTEPAMDTLYTQGRLEGYQLLYIGNPEEADDELVLTALVAPHLRDRYPYVYVRIQPKLGDAAPDVDALLLDAGCIRLV